jgi:hypothetical protein
MAIILPIAGFCIGCVGRAILPAAAFQAALSGHARVFTPGKRRLKTGGSQDWLPHN